MCFKHLCPVADVGAVNLFPAHNVDASRAHQFLTVSTHEVARSMQRLSSGLRLTSAGDDPAAMGISMRMRAQLQSLEQAKRNSQDGISILNIIDGALGEAHSILQRARELHLQFDNTTADSDARRAIGQELLALSAQMGQIEERTKFNGINLLKSGLDSITLQIGPGAADLINFPLATLIDSIGALVNENDFFLLPFFNGDTQTIDDDITRVSEARGRFAGVRSRLEYTLEAHSRREETLLQADSRIRDVDMAFEVANLTKWQVKQQSDVAMLALGNQQPDHVMRLLGMA